MSIKQVKIIKIVRILLGSLYFYSMLNLKLLSINHEISFFLISFSLLICAVALPYALPKEYQTGNTFLKPKLKWLEVILEIIIMIGLALILSLF